MGNKASNSTQVSVAGDGFTRISTSGCHSSYNSSVNRYNNEVQNYINQLQNYVYDAQSYANCEIQSLD